MTDKFSKSDREKKGHNWPLRTTDTAGILFTIIAIVLIIYGLTHDSAFLVILGFFSITSALFVITSPDKVSPSVKNTQMFGSGNIDIGKPLGLDSSLIEKEIRETMEKAKEEILKARAGIIESVSDTVSQVKNHDALEKEIWAARQKVSEKGKEISSWHQSAIDYIDYLDRTIGLEGLDENYRKSCIQARSEFMKTMEKMGVTEINPATGDAFDDRRHIAEGEKALDGAGPGVIAEVERVGFAVGNKVLRPARVRITPESESELSN